ncbi:hypothetical protein Q0Z83_028860 [Actinoplanes sichuanensis]|uniref:DUF4190 domain-containing protein n=1 Tax=Actinoplanes sichuanensis TaxID=512349 RepID=A0ABW4AUG2_9ACTN|nr:DUF4190 domain-containing protein [Actinoplanes sichuanensis]BEL04695.1 hypothetical protein Q0Z83_028860 [Actinoplanes sichuanensis]
MSYNPYEPNHDPYRQPQPQFPPEPYSPGVAPPYPPQTPSPYPAQSFPPPPPTYQAPPPHYGQYPGFHGHYRPHAAYGYQQPMLLPTSGWATAALVLGIVGILTGWCLAGIPSLAAIITGHIGLAETNTGTRGGRGLAVAGLILGYLAVIPGAALFFLTVVGSLTGAGS